MFSFNPTTTLYTIILIFFFDLAKRFFIAGWERERERERK
jgi:hypothetical protein